MTTLCRLTMIAVLALVGVELNAQTYNQMEAGPATKLDGVAQAVYTGLSDVNQTEPVQHVAFQALSDTTRQVAHESISDQGIRSIPATEQATLSISDLASSGAGQISQTGLLLGAGPSCGAAACGPTCGLPGGCSPGCGAPAPSCGVAGPACGAPAPGCGLPEVACGLPSSPSCGGGLFKSIFGGGGGCDSGSCDSCGGSEVMCGSLCDRKCPDCCGVGTHYSYIYGELLYMRSRQSEVTYAVPSDGPIIPGSVPVQVGNFGVIDSDYDLGYRVGFNLALDTVSSVNARYLSWSNRESDSISLAAPNALESLVSHPATISSASTTLAAHADYYIDLQNVDVDYRHLLKCCEVFSANYVIGARYANLEQGFDVEFLKQPTESVWTDVDFEGAGLRLGLETQRYSCRNQLHVYASGYASFMAGRFSANYLQGSSVDPEIVNAQWDADRLVPILDFEAGIGWTSIDGKLRLNAGYMTSAWFNSVTTQSWIDGVQANDFSDITKSLWFDGLQARVSYSF